MTPRHARLIAIDGVNGAAVARNARAAKKTAGRQCAGVSWWDASGLFEQLVMADRHAGAPSARTLLLLYAADLAFRLRWEIEPKLAEGRTVVAAPYIDTAVAFGHAAGLGGRWLTNLFQFAQRPGEQRAVPASRRAEARHTGFVAFACTQVSGRELGLSKRQLVARTDAHLVLLSARSQRHGTQGSEPAGH